MLWFILSIPNLGGFIGKSPCFNRKCHPLNVLFSLTEVGYSVAAPGGKEAERGRVGVGVGGGHELDGRSVASAL